MALKILFTGSSSFTGMWFIQELICQGHQVTAIFQKDKESYSDIRKERVDRISRYAHTCFNCPFGSEQFLAVINNQKHWDLLCHHAANVNDYKSPDFNPASALLNNTHNLKNVLQALKNNGCHKVLLTGSVFEQGEGAGSEGLRAVSPYGLSKGLTSEVFQYYTQILDMCFGKFVIPNPFGPFEEKRFTSFLVESWFKRIIPSVDSPAYVRDNIHVSLLAKAYVHFATLLEDKPGIQKLNPSGYPESQGAFTIRFANELCKRLSLPCEVNICEQIKFTEPKVRLNTDILDNRNLQWSETEAWDELASYYQQRFTKLKV